MYSSLKKKEATKNIKRWHFLLVEKIRETNMTLLRYFGKSSSQYQAINTQKIQKEIKLR